MECRAISEEVADACGVHHLCLLTATCVRFYLVSEEHLEDAVGKLGCPLGKASHVGCDVLWCIDHLRRVVAARPVGLGENPSTATVVALNL